MTWNEEIQKRAEELCKLPSGRAWYWQEALSEEESSTPGGVPDKVIIEGYAGCHDLFENGFLSRRDAQFIAGARQFLSPALERIRELEAALEKSICAGCYGNGKHCEERAGLIGMTLGDCKVCGGKGKVKP